MDGISSITPIIIEPANESAEHQHSYDRRKPKGTKRVPAPEDPEGKTQDEPEAGAESAEDEGHLLDLDA